jgi:orotidine-5'-phosphate decarboxylase
MPEAAAAAEPAGRESFGSRLGRAMADRGPLCVGIDPHPALLQRWGLADDAAGLERFSLTVLEAVGSLAAAVKPQVALYERHGSAGMAVLERTLAAAAAASVLSIADAKRGDIGSTMAAYADAWLRDGSALAADSVTLSPYLGFESLRPALDLAAQSGRGVFVLALTSNPEGASVQHAGGADSVARRIVQAAAVENRRYSGGPGRAESRTEDLGTGEFGTGERGTGEPGTVGLGSVGLVVGATVGSALADLGLDLAAVRGPILAPGLGAQGATAADLRRTFGSAYAQVLGTSSRDILGAGPRIQDLRDAARRTLDELRAA